MNLFFQATRLRVNFGYVKLVRSETAINNSRDGFSNPERFLSIFAVFSVLLLQIIKIILLFL